MSKKTEAQTEAQELPRSWDDVEQVAAAWRTLADARELLNTAQDREHQLSLALEGEDTPGDEITELGERVLQGEAVGTLRADCAQVMAELANTQAEVRILSESVRLAEERHKQARVQAMEETILPQVSAQYKQIVARLADLLIELGKADAKESDFRHVYLHGELHLFPGKIRVMRLPFDRARAAAWLAEAVEYGFIDAGVIADFDAERE